ncbi:ABC-three component system protein, partial [Rhizobium bangladeshense]|uniref:ABC-three component system protein n=1 Tax=Rhizobium bangladeshense TaxID=1138189 RepID=UPI0007E553C7
ALDYSEEHLIYIERNDDIEFVTQDGRISLSSLKHKAEGDRLSDLSTDFWKSVRIWLVTFKETGRTASKARFQLFTTSEISAGSFLDQFADYEADGANRARDAATALNRSRSELIAKVKDELAVLTAEEASDFYSRITIFPQTPRIEDIPSLVSRRLITVRKESRADLFQRLEGWWIGLVIQTLTGERKEPIKVQELHDRLAVLADDYKVDSLPIEFSDKLPEGNIDANADRRRFVEQLRALKLSADRIRYAIIDYYRAFEQRSSWARANLIVSGEIEKYEDKLVEEWGRYKAAVCEHLTEESKDDACVAAGRELYNWAENSTGQLRIRERVAEQYVVRGTFHILANGSPEPRVHWHPRFLQQIAKNLEVAA